MVRASGATTGLTRGIVAAFGAGTVSGLSDTELLDRHLARLDDGASFEAIIARHGPMVLRVCRDVLGDEHAAEDAFQATFLVLVRKARSVRVDGSLGRWLYGVAHRVARHARADAARRRKKEGSAAEVGSYTHERDDTSIILHEELTRLPETYRTPIVLCHLEGLTHEEAAARLRWPLGTVRSRIARGRERLRGRLERRGAAPAILGLDVRPLPTLPAHLTNLTAGGTASAAVLTLTEGVLMSLTFGTWKLVAVGLLAVGTMTAATTAVLARQDAPRSAEKAQEKQKPAADKPAVEAPPAGPFRKPRGADDSDPFARPTAPSIGELFARYNTAAEAAGMSEELYRRGEVNRIGVAEARGKAEAIRAQINDLSEAWREELEVLQVRLRKAKAEERRAQGQVELSNAKVAINERLNRKMKGAVSTEELRQADADTVVNTAAYDSAEADRELIELRITHIKRRLDRIVDLEQQRKAEDARRLKTERLTPPAAGPAPVGR